MGTGSVGRYFSTIEEAIREDILFSIILGVIGIAIGVYLAVVYFRLYRVVRNIRVENKSILDKIVKLDSYIDVKQTINLPENTDTFLENETSEKIIEVDITSLRDSFDLTEYKGGEGGISSGLESLNDEFVLEELVAEKSVYEESYYRV